MQRAFLSCLLIFCLLPHVLSVGGTIQLATLTAAQGLTFQPSSMGSDFGTSIASCDFNGDGVKDVIIGAPSANSGMGAVVVIYGGSDFSTVDVSDPAASGSGMILTSAGAAGFGIKVACLENADLNTATEELVIGESSQMTFWVIFGQSGMASNQDISSLLKYVLTPGGSESLLDAVAVGDVTGDGKGDLIISVRDGSEYRGVLITDFVSGSVDISTPTTNQVVWITNSGQSEQMTFAPAGVFNGDSYQDFVVGNLQGTVIGSAAVIFGTDGVGSPYPTTIDLTSLNLGTTPQVLFITGDSIYKVGTSVGYAGDVNGDGFDDILVGSSDYGTDIGAVFIVFGISTFASDVDLTGIPSNSEGYIITHVTEVGYQVGNTVFGGLYTGSDPVVAVCDLSTNCYFNFVKSSTNDLDAMLSEDGFKIYNTGSAASNPMQIALIGDINSDGYEDYLIGQGSVSTVFILYGPNKCTSPCKTCSGLTSADWTKCVSCESGLSLDLLYNYACYGSCPSHSYQDSGTTCASCHASCLDCTDSTSSGCTSCDSGGTFPLFYSSACYAIGLCPSHSYQDSTTTCATCDSTCLECTTSGPNACSSCDLVGSLPLFYSNACYGTCPSHTYQNSGTTCATCDSTCLECTSSDPNACSSCDSGGTSPLFYNTACYAIGSCPSHSYQDSGTTCASCHATCLDCTDPTSSGCTSCDSGGSLPLLYSNVCYGSCPSGTYQDSSSTCIDCDGNCGECSGSATSCISCQGGDFLYNNACYGSCPSHSYQDSVTTCAKCSGSATSCTTCDSAGSYPLFYNSYCYGTCPSGTYQDSATTCASCDGSCKNCAGSATTCTSCDTSGSLPLFYSSACYSSCPPGAPYSYSYVCYTECPSGTAADSKNACITTTPEVPEAVQTLSSTDETRQVSNEVMSTISSLTLGGVHSIRSQSVQGPVSYYVFLNVDYPSNYGQFAKSNYGSSRMPNPFRNTGRTGGGRVGAINAYLDNQSLLANIGYSIIFLGVCILLIPINDAALALLEKHTANCQGKWYHRLLKRSSVSLRWSFLINQFVSKYQDLAFFSFLGVYNAGDDDNDQDALNLVVCILGFLIVVAGLGGVLFLIKSLTKKLKTLSEEEKEKEEYINDDFLGRRVVLYKDLKKDQFMTMLYPWFLMVRVFGFCFVAIFLCNQPAVQLTFLNLYAILMLVYLFKYRPLEERGQLWMTLAYEIDGFLALFGVTILAIYNQAGGTSENTKSVFGYFIIVANTGMLVLNFISFFLEIQEYAVLIYQKLKMIHQELKDKKKVRPQPIQPKESPFMSDPGLQSPVIRTPSAMPEGHGYFNDNNGSPGLPSPNNMSEVKLSPYSSCLEGGLVDDKSTLIKLENSMDLRRNSPRKRFTSTRASLKFQIEEEIPEAEV